MTTTDDRRSRIALGLSLGLLALSLATCHHGKRPTVLSQTPSGQSTPTTAPPPLPPPTDSGPDVDRLRNDAAFGQDLATPPADAPTEGGPLEDIHFDYDSSALNDAARQTLAQHAAWLKSHSAVHVTVEGHCDDRGTTDYNLALGEQRARAAKDYLVGLGVAEGRMRSVSFGKEKPVDPGSNEAAWAKNRRAHFVVSGR